MFGIHDPACKCCGWDSSWCPASHVAHAKKTAQESKTEDTEKNGKACGMKHLSFFLLPSSFTGHPSPNLFHLTSFPPFFSCVCLLPCTYVFAPLLPPLPRPPFFFFILLLFSCSLSLSHTCSCSLFFLHHTSSSTTILTHKNRSALCFLQCCCSSCPHLYLKRARKPTHVHAATPLQGTRTLHAHLKCRPQLVKDSRDRRPMCSVPHVRVSVLCLFARGEVHELRAMGGEHVFDGAPQTCFFQFAGPQGTPSVHHKKKQESQPSDASPK